MIGNALPESVLETNSMTIFKSEWNLYLKGNICRLRREVGWWYIKQFSRANSDMMECNTVCAVKFDVSNGSNNDKQPAKPTGASTVDGTE